MLYILAFAMQVTKNILGTCIKISDQNVAGNLRCVCLLWYNNLNKLCKFILHIIAGIMS